MCAEPNDKTVLMSCGVRPGRGEEAERTQAQALMEKEIGTMPDEMTLVMHEFDQHMFISGGGQLPPLGDGTSELKIELEPA